MRAGNAYHQGDSANQFSQLCSSPRPRVAKLHYFHIAGVISIGVASRAFKSIHNDRPATGVIATAARRATRGVTTIRYTLHRERRGASNPHAVYWGRRYATVLLAVLGALRRYYATRYRPEGWGPILITLHGGCQGASTLHAKDLGVPRRYVDTRYTGAPPRYYSTHYRPREPLRYFDTR